MATYRVAFEMEFPVAAKDISFFSAIYFPNISVFDKLGVSHVPNAVLTEVELVSE